MSMSQRALNVVMDENASVRRRLAATRVLRVWVFIYRFHLIREARKAGYSWSEIREARRP